MKKKVLFVITKSNWGGAQRYVFDLATSLPKEKFEAVFAFGPAPDGKPGKLSKMLFEKGIRTILVPELARDVAIFRDLHALRALRNLFAAEKPHITHLNSSKAGGLGALAARLTGVPHVVFTIHGLPSDEQRPFVQQIAIACATWMTVLLSHATIVISNDTLERVRHMPFLRRKVHLIWNGIVSPLFLSKADARKELRTLDPEIPGDAIWIGMNGELHPNKDYPTAIEAMTYMESAHLVVISEGELRTQLIELSEKKNVRDRVHFLGFVPEAAKYLRAFDAFLLTSQKEGLPYVLLEAGLAYIPVVATHIGGVKDVILNEFTGLLVPPHDAQKTAKAVERVTGDATLTRSLSDELLKRVQQSFSLDGMVRKTIELYERRTH